VPADVTGPFGGPGPVDSRPQQLDEYRSCARWVVAAWAWSTRPEQESLGRRRRAQGVAAHAVLDARHLQRISALKARAAAGCTIPTLCPSTAWAT